MFLRAAIVLACTVAAAEAAVPGTTFAANETVTTNDIQSVDIVSDSKKAANRDAVAREITHVLRRQSELQRPCACASAHGSDILADLSRLNRTSRATGFPQPYERMERVNFTRPVHLSIGSRSGDKRTVTTLLIGAYPGGNGKTIQTEIWIERDGGRGVFEPTLIQGDPFGLQPTR